MTDTSRGETVFGDDAIMRRVRDGESAALGELYDRYARPCFALARRILTDSGLAEDVVQEVFLAVWRRPDRFDPSRGSFASWLLAATHHKAVDSVRREETRRRRRSSTNVDDERLVATPTDTPPVEDQVWATLRGERVRAALDQLPRPQRDALMLAYFGGYTQREVAEMTETPLGTVKTRMFAGLRRLRDLLEVGTGPDETGAST
ncbi:MAG: sigma-70 family RNA polymerase sigma factor [Mycobacteriales bacterium]